MTVFTLFSCDLLGESSLFGAISSLLENSVVSKIQGKRLYCCKVVSFCVFLNVADVELKVRRREIYRLNINKSISSH